MTGKVIQGSFLGGQPRWASSVWPKVALSLVQAKTAGPPATAFAGPPTGAPPPAFAARRPGPSPTGFAVRLTDPLAAVQRHGAGGAFAVETGPLGLVNGGGRPLPEAVRGKMEAALGADFSAVRVHVGPQAERIGAIAFTVGTDLYFAPGRYQPDTIQGQQLLGHELAHVVQQRQGRVRSPLGSGLAVVQDRALEAEADRMGRQAVMARLTAQTKMRSGAVLSGGATRVSAPALPENSGLAPSPSKFMLGARAVQRQKILSGSFANEARYQQALAALEYGISQDQGSARFYSKLGSDAYTHIEFTTGPIAGGDSGLTDIKVLQGGIWRSLETQGDQIAWEKIGKTTPIVIVITVNPGDRAHLMAGNITQTILHEWSVHALKYRATLRDLRSATQSESGKRKSWGRLTNEGDFQHDEYGAGENVNEDNIQKGIREYYENQGLTGHSKTFTAERNFDLYNHG